MSRSEMAIRCPGAQPLGVARLPGWRFIIGGGGYASIAAVPGNEVIGVLWRITPRDVAALNSYENVDGGFYRRERLMVRHRGAAKSVIVYIGRGEGRPRPGAVELIVKSAREWQLPSDYVRMLQRWMPSQRRAGAIG
jgi:hypothetical protein